MKAGQLVQDNNFYAHEGNHLCCMDEDDQQYRDVTAHFMREGLEQGHKVLYIYAETSPAVIIATLRTLDEKADQAVLNGRLVFRSIKEICLPGAANPLREVPNLIRDEMEKAAADGYPVLRCLIEVMPPQTDAFEPRSLVEYETALNEICASLPVIVLCRYNRHQRS